jgi:hypothetical protein
MSNAQLVVSRKDPKDVQERQVVLSLDGEHWTSLTFGQSASRDLAPGPHVLKADNTLFRKTAAFEAAAGEDVRFAVVSRRGPLSTLFLLVGAPWYYVDLVRE